jgi:hypothetical protein
LQLIPIFNDNSAQNRNASSNNQQQQNQQYKNNQNRRKSLKEQNKKNRNSPHNNWSLHNHPPRKIRNIIPEAPTQNVPTLPQNSAPLIRQHRRHSWNEKSKSKIYQEHPNKEANNTLPK